MSEILSPLGLGLAGKRLLSELPYKLVPSTNIIEKLLFVNVENQKIYFSSFYGILEVDTSCQSAATCAPARQNTKRQRRISVRVDSDSCQL